MPTRGASNKSQQLPPLGPLFRQVEAVDGRAVSPASLVAAGRASPVVVRGAASSWPALGAWSFSALADAAAASQCVGTLQAGLAEQGATQPPVCTPASAYLSNLAAAAPSVPPGDGLAPSGSDEAAALEGGLETRLRWSFLSSFKPDAPYLAQWDMLRQIPVLRADAPTAATLWPRWWRSFDFVWLGPARTVTGLHFDRPANWFTQLRGVKEVVLLPPGNAHLLPLNGKYDFGCVGIPRVHRIQIPRFNMHSRSRHLASAAAARTRARSTSRACPSPRPARWPPSRPRLARCTAASRLGTACSSPRFGSTRSSPCPHPRPSPPSATPRRRCSPRG